MLLAVARLGSFNAAAKALAFTPSAVWQQMRALEQEAGTQLFERGPRGMRLTESGQILVGHADVALRQLDQAEAELTAIARGEGGRLLFGSFPTATESFVADVVSLFRAAHPDVELHFRDAEPYEHVPSLEALKCDCVVMFDLDGWPSARRYDGELVSGKEDVVYEPLFDDPYSLALPADHRLVGHETVALAQLAGEVILGSPEKCAPWGVELARLADLEGFEPRFAAHYDSHDFHAMQALVAAGQGLSLLPELSLGCIRRDIAIRPLEPTPVRHVKLGFPRTSYRSAACDALVAILRDVIEERFGVDPVISDGNG
jgi:DNA-binding transcriptional LysR family regulator